MSDMFVGDAPAREARQVPTLTVLFRASSPLERPSRHRLDGIDVVCFGRGDRRAERDRHAGMRRLTVRVADPLMSSDHGRLLCVHGQWLFEDPRSKNGAVVDGNATRAAQIQPGALLMLGHTLFLFDVAPTSDLPDDRFADEPSAPWPTLATLDDTLARDVDLLSRAAPSELPVVLLGETGTGKEVFARAVHAMSGRRGAFVAVNSGGLAPSLVESEFFGHRKGSFSGATHDRPGYLRSADGGTLFLDEIGELPMPAQTALLRALQLREVVPVGDAVPVPVDLRIVAATHRSLPSMVAAGSFREDLYARLLGVTITLPPLRSRRCDIGLLTGALLRSMPGGDRAQFAPDAAIALARHRWPLNVRELERSLAAALALAGREPISLGYLPASVVSPVPAEGSVDQPGKAPVDRERIEHLLRTHTGNVSRVASALHTSRSQVMRLIARFGLTTDQFRNG